MTFQPNAARCVFLRHNDRQTKTFSWKTSCKFPSNPSAALQAALPGGGFAAGRQEGKSAAGECEERAEPSAAGYGAGKHNIGHHRKQQVAAVAAHGEAGGPERGWWGGGSASARIALARKVPPRHLLLLYTATCGPPVSRPSLKPGIHLSRAEYLSLMHKYLSFPPGIFVSPYICISHISVSAKYLSRPNVFITYLFLRVGVFSLFHFQVTSGKIYFVKIHFCEILHQPPTPARR